MHILREPDSCQCHRRAYISRLSSRQLATYVRPVRGVPPHNLATADPHANALVDVLASPTEHLCVKSTTLVPPSFGQARKTSREHAHVHVIGAAPFEIAVPRHIALGHTATSSYLRPRVDVQ
eukprot:CAMPEP_0169199324 /NCGR_PEP_ID=MMETSP1016-20121227/9284_1 /TAXON_ID=342587 /ORGANISM="Karlodinium micrum, Strain CCMP2283" /LENGTH=121 /DNA_ID=CAMNT_0009276117 /DNA_START=31 /DNA_END=396 /DNA_ORIENTATION=+